MKNNKITNILFLISATFLMSSSFPTEKLETLEIVMGQAHSIKLMEEGLLCKTMDSNFNTHLKFFSIKELEKEDFFIVQDFIRDPLFLEMDSTIYVPGESHSGFDISIKLIYETKVKKIIWSGGQNEKLQKLLSLINKLIPKVKRKRFMIVEPKLHEIFLIAKKL